MPPEPSPIPITQVLLADDDPSSVDTLTALAAEADLELRTAATYDEVAVGLRASSGRALLLLNLHAGPDAGTRFMETLAADTALRTRCTVVDIVRALGHGDVLPARAADRVIERPLTPRELVSVIRDYLGWSRE